MKFLKEKKIQINSAQRGFDSYDFKLGDLFRGERATLGISLMDVQRALKINVDTISAIENCEISVEQNSVFISGYVKSYAKFLNLDPDWVYDRFCEETGYKNPALPDKKGFELNNNFKNQKSKKKKGKDQTKFDQSYLNSLKPAKSLKFRSLMSIFSIFVIILSFGVSGMFILNTIQKVQIVEDENLPIIVEQAIALNPKEPNMENNNINNFKESLVFTPRDGPIIDIDTSQTGIFVSNEKKNQSTTAFKHDNNLIEEYKDIFILASRPAWVRLYTPEGKIIDEKILDVSQTMKVPSNINDVFLRSGNAGSVFIKIGNMTFGPIGEGTEVVKDISLSSENILKNYEIVTDEKLLTPLDRLKVITEKTN